MHAVHLLTISSDGSDEAKVAASSSLEQAYIAGAAAMGISIDDSINQILLESGTTDSTAVVSICYKTTC
jgi:3-hydroxy-3-methylglutaryl CoA synthase